MAFIRLQGEIECQAGIYYEYDPAGSPLGEGGMGKVFRGWCCNERTNQRREVAIKFLYSDLPSHVIARARREAAVMLRNDSLVEMLGFMELRDVDQLGQPVIRYHVISEYLHGVTLDKLLVGNVTDSSGQIIPFAQELYGKYLNSPYDFAITVIRSILSGLMALHDAGYIHRDIDPSNIMITSGGKIKLIDFGIAKKVNGQNTKESSYTVDGQFIGKPKYAAPELVRGLVDSQNATTDLYAVGILLFQLLTGTVPFDGEMAEVLEMQLNKKMPLHLIKQKQIKEVIKKATDKKRSLRFQSAAEFRVAIDKLVGLTYPEARLDLRKVLIYGGGSVAAALAIVLCLNIFRSGGNGLEVRAPEPEIIAENVDTDTEVEAVVEPAQSYDRAVALLSDKSSAQEGLSMLKDLADGKDYQSMFLLSRLYFDSREKVKVGAFSDSITLFRQNLNIPAKNNEAHNLLKAAIAVNGEDYHSLFELGCDYKSKSRGAKFNPDSAYIVLNKARHLADEAGDKEYIQAISNRMTNLKPRK